jgi:hypothetical protein
MIGALKADDYYYQCIYKESNNKRILLLPRYFIKNSNHKEYYSYSLFIELKNKYKLQDIVYKNQSYKKFFEVNGREISFDYETGKYVIEWKNVKEFASREEVIKKILEFAKEPKLSS